MIRSKSEKIFEIVCIVIAALFLLLCVYPFLYALFVSVCSEQEWSDRGGILLFFPSRPTGAAYAKIFGVGSYVLQSLGISLLRTVAGTVLSLLLTAVMGYILTVDFPGKKYFIYLLLFTIFFSGGLIPNYLVVKELGLLNNFWVMVLPNLINAWNVLVFKQFFLGIPKEIQEAAKMDGISELGLFWRIMMPLSFPVVASVGLFIMVFHWNSWFDVSLYSRDGTWDTLQIILYRLLNQANAKADITNQQQLYMSMRTIQPETVRAAGRPFLG